jgi:hypothetical protein
LGQRNEENDSFFLMPPGDLYSRVGDEEALRYVKCDLI